MITGVQDVYYNITDRDRAVAFYTKALGLKVISVDPHWVALDCNGIRIGLHPEREVDQVPRDGHGASGQATLTLRSDDVSADRRQIEKNGGKILSESENPWGHMLTFEDPDGNVLKLMKPPDPR